MSTQPDSTVFVSRSGGRRCYHAEPDCYLLQMSVKDGEEPKEYDPEWTPFNLRPCKDCYGGGGT